MFTVVHHYLATPLLKYVSTSGLVILLHWFIADQIKHYNYLQ